MVMVNQSGFPAHRVCFGRWSPSSSDDEHESDYIEYTEATNDDIAKDTTHLFTGWACGFEWGYRFILLRDPDGTYEVRMVDCWYSDKRDQNFENHRENQNTNTFPLSDAIWMLEHVFQAIVDGIVDSTWYDEELEPYVWKRNWRKMVIKDCQHCPHKFWMGSLYCMNQARDDKQNPLWVRPNNDTFSRIDLVVEPPDWCPLDKEGGL